VHDHLIEGLMAAVTAEAAAEMEVSYSHAFQASRDAAELLRRHAERSGGDEDEQLNGLIEFVESTISEHVLSHEVLSADEVETLVADVGVELDAEEASGVFKSIANMTKPETYTAEDEESGDEDDGTCEVS